MGYSPALNDVVNYLAGLYDQGFMYRTIKVHQLALSYTLVPIDGHNAGNHQMVYRLLMGVFNLRPPVRTLFPMWCVKEVIMMLRLCGPAGKLDLKTLTHKTLMQLALATATATI